MMTTEAEADKIRQVALAVLRRIAELRDLPAPPDPSRSITDPGQPLAGWEGPI